MIRSRPVRRLPSKTAPLSRLPFPPRSRRLAISRRHRSHEHESSWLGDQRRRTVSTMEKLIDDLKVLDDSVLRPPDLRRHLGPPVVVAGDGLTIARDVERGS